MIDFKKLILDQIKAEYSKLESDLKKSRGLVYDTEKGIYGTTDIENIYKFFNEIHLEAHKNFLDLGSGDGRVVFVASLFTSSTGIEYDPDLVSTAKLIQKKLDIQATFIQGDYMALDFSKYDVIFINPDHNLALLSQKLLREFKGKLFVHNEIFPLECLKKGKKYWLGQTPVIEYVP
jgi:SAM-dependent methyltransferase